MILGSTWAVKKGKTGMILTLVRLIGNHPDKNRKNEIIVLALNLISGELQEMVFNTKKDEFPFTRLRRM